MPFTVRVMPGPPAVEFRDVTKRFGDGPLVLDRISFQVQPGEFISVVGPSGCGKSTLLRLIAGLTPPTSGSLTVDGTTPSAAASRLAFVFQEPNLLPWLSVARNIEVPQKLHGIPAHERSVSTDRALDLVGLKFQHNAYPRQLSGGQKMRVSLARALTLNPGILLLDEPFGALDELTREHLNEELLGLREIQEWTAFFVTHSVAEAVFLSTRILLLSANPGYIHAEIPVPLPRLRTVETRLSREYHELVAHVSRLLRSVEVNPAAVEP